VAVDSKPQREMHTAMGECVVLKKLGMDTERKRGKGNGWAYFVLELYDNYAESKSNHENERLQSDVSSYDFFEMQDDVSEFYYMVIEYYRKNPVSDLRICEKGK
jgi:phage terminase Nu1 subunit (DNA packaging protein)